jgi:hypothetical protein
MKDFFKNYSSVFATLLLFVVLLTPALALGAATGQPTGGATGQPFGGATGQPSGGATSPRAGQVVSLDNPLGGVTSFCQLITKILEAVMAIGIPIAILFIVWAGFQFVLAQGNPGGLEKARRNFLNVIIGIGIFVGSSLIAQVIINTLHDLGVRGINSC